MSRIVIVGGGIWGLTLAHRLHRLAPGHDVTILERSSRAGGVVGTVERDGFRVETGPNGFLDSNPALFQLCQELGIADQLCPASEIARRNRFLFLRGKLRKLPSGPLSFFSSDALSWRSKFALLTERFRRRRARSEDESVEEFARRRTNDELTRTLVDAFVTGIHAADAGLLSVRAAFPRLANLEREHGSVMGGFAAAARQRRQEARARGEEPRRGMRMWSFPQGLGFLIEALTRNLPRPPVLGAAVRSVERTQAGWDVHLEGQAPLSAESVVLACPAQQQSALLAGLDPVLADDVGTIAYNRIAVVALGYRRAEVAHPLDGFGYLTPGRDRRDVLGVQWCSSIYPGRVPEGHVLLRALCGGWHRAEMVSWSEDRLLQAVRQELRQVMGIAAEPVFVHIQKWDRAIPQYHVGHLARVARVEERLKNHPGLYLGGNCYRGIALSDCAEQAGLLAQRIAQESVPTPDPVRK